jgi:AcrR family transcriptional regulator
LAAVLEAAMKYPSLPRGRHGISREEVAGNQRLRLMGAAAEAIAERGYAALVVGDVIDRARVSRATFYKLFEDKRDCVLASQTWAFEQVRSSIAAAVAAAADEPDTPRCVVAGIRAALDFASTNPGPARLVLAASQSPSEPDLAREDLAVDSQLLTAMREWARSHGRTPASDELTELAAVGAALSIVGGYLGAGEASALPELEGDLVQILLGPYLGAAAAKRVATAA